MANSDDLSPPLCPTPLWEYGPPLPTAPLSPKVRRGPVHLWRQIADTRSDAALYRDRSVATVRGEMLGTRLAAMAPTRPCALSERRDRVPLPFANWRRLVLLDALYGRAYLNVGHPPHTLWPVRPGAGLWMFRRYCISGVCQRGVFAFALVVCSWYRVPYNVFTDSFRFRAPASDRPMQIQKTIDISSAPFRMPIYRSVTDSALSRRLRRCISRHSCAKT